MTVFPRASVGLTWAVLCLLPTLALAAPRFNVAGLNANNEVRLRTSTAHVETVLRVDLLPGSPEAGGEAPPVGEPADTRVTVLVDPLLSTDGTQVPVTVRVGTATDGATEAPISVRQPVTVALSADLPAPGEYRGRVVLLGDGVREVASLLIQRVAVAPTVQFYPVAPARGWTLGPFSGKATVRLTFKETAGVGGEVGPAAVVQLDRKEGGAGNGAAPVQAQDAHWSFRGQAASGDDASADGGMGPGGVFQVPANGTGLLSLDVDGLPESGEYTGTVRLLVPQGAPVEQTFTVWVKTPALWGAFLIFLGVVTSAAVRFYVQRVRPRVTLRSRAEAARQKLQELVPARPLEREAAVASALRRQVDALLENIQRPLSGLVVQDSVLALFEARLQLFSLWSVLLRQLEGLKGMALLDAEKKLKSVETLLQNDQATSADFTEQAQYLRTLDLEGVARAVLESRLEELEQQSQTLVSQRGDDAVSRRLQGELPMYVLKARQQLPGTDLETSRRLVDTAREAFLEILLSDLEGSLSGRELPGGFTPEEWTELRTRVAEQLARARARKSASVDEAFLYYQSAQSLYLRALVDNLEEALAAARLQGGGDLSAQFDWEADVDARLKSARAHLNQGETNLATPDYRAAREAFERHATLRQKAASIGTRQTALEAFPDVTLDPFSQKPAEAPPPLPGAPAGGNITPLPPPGTTKTGTEALVNLDWIPLPRSGDLWKVELAVLGMMSIIAVLLGLQLLDVFSPTWGGSGAWMSAFLWGFGLHQVGNATFDGLWGMVSRMEK
ncbi:hypothetical protein D7Y13_08750 [Corallococcus praedator]|uniref:Protein BatD n=1 Tax=Corallococcus praedator TaxID=2316724 RepID=A0ABX9QNX6_9BACT|nr:MULTISPECIES: hypothetical protein [Corallococcus]RKH33129.1 hypothetical protein D7X75_13345 [Corallococcus sp. CA031C]RKI12731.1 hypothetical protein D7Y13_08750 [Corallococcus praedator]